MSRVFKFLVGTRGRLYENGILQAYRLHHPVVSVGNLTLGGTGKTPLVILLAERLRDDGFRPVVLSRGYKRKSSGLLVVSSGAGPEVSWRDAGDEPFLIARRTRGVSVVVGADRHAAGLLAEQKKLGDLFLLDDGFQHRRLFRDVDLVTIDPEEWSAGEQLLPAGRWREPREAIARAHAAITQASSAPIPPLPVPSFTAHAVVEGIYRENEPVPVQSLRNKAITAFAGIAKPDRFFSTLEGLGLSPIRRIRFQDHHTYSRRELEDLGGEIQITTEKDAIRLEDMGAGVFLHVRISVKIPEFERLIELIRGRFR